MLPRRRKGRDVDPHGTSPLPRYRPTRARGRARRLQRVRRIGSSPAPGTGFHPPRSLPRRPHTSHTDPLAASAACFMSPEPSTGSVAQARARQSHLSRGDRSRRLTGAPVSRVIHLASAMTDVSIRELRNHGGDVIERVVRGERVTITRGGRAVAELRPLQPPGPRTDVLVTRWSRLPAMSPGDLRRDVDAAIDGRL